MVIPMIRQAGQAGSTGVLCSSCSGKEGVLCVCVCVYVGRVTVDGGSRERYIERMGEEARVKCRGEREDR